MGTRHDHLHIEDSRLGMSGPSSALPGTPSRLGMSGPSSALPGTPPRLGMSGPLSALPGAPPRVGMSGPLSALPGQPPHHQEIYFYDKLHDTTATTTTTKTTNNTNTTITTTRPRTPLTLHLTSVHSSRRVSPNPPGTTRAQADSPTHFPRGLPGPPPPPPCKHACATRVSMRGKRTHRAVHASPVVLASPVDFGEIVGPTPKVPIHFEIPSSRPTAKAVPPLPRVRTVGQPSFRSGKDGSQGAIEPVWQGQITSRWTELTLHTR